MKKVILIAIFIIINNATINAFELTMSYFNYSYSLEFSETDTNNHSLGLELFYESFQLETLNCFGFNFHFGENGNILNLHYYLMPDYNNWIVFEDALSALSFGIGTNISYNMSKNIFGIGPQVNMNVLIFLAFKFNITYRYNIYFNADNSSEIEFSIGIYNILFR
jgi:hypothetical protein